MKIQQCPICNSPMKLIATPDGSIWVCTKLYCQLSRAVVTIQPSNKKGRR